MGGLQVQLLYFAVAYVVATIKRSKQQLMTEGLNLLEITTFI